MNRQCKEYTMRCVSAKWNAVYGVSLRLKDDYGETKTSFWAGNTGMVWDAFGLSRGDDWSLAIGKEVVVWFNVNGVAARLKKCERYKDGYHST